MRVMLKIVSNIKVLYYGVRKFKIATVVRRTSYKDEENDEPIAIKSIRS